MKELVLETLIQKALQHKKGDWHFHVLTPHCMFNDTASYKIILEVPEGQYFSLSDILPSADLQRLEHHFYRS